MSRRPARTRRPLVATLLALLFALPVAAHPSRLDPRRVAWRELHLSASKLFVTARTHVALRPVGRTDVTRELGTATFAEGVAPLAPRGDVYRLEIDVQLAGRPSSDVLFFQAEDATALLRRKADLGKSPYDKVYRHGRDGVALLRRAPANGTESKLAADRWSHIERYDYPHPQAARRACPAVSEPSALLYVVSALDLAPGQQVELCVFTGKQLHRVVIEGGGLETLQGHHVEVAADGAETRRQGPFEARRLFVRPRPVGGDGKAEEFELLGLAGDIELLVDRKSRVPLVVQGRLPHLGSVEVRLDRVVLR